MCGKDDNYENVIQSDIEQHRIRLILIGRESVRKLSRRENEIFDAYFLQGRINYQQIADDFNISKASVETYITRALQKIEHISLSLE